MADVALAEVVHEIRRLATSPEVKERSDQDLLGEFQACRDQTAFAALVERHGPLVLRVCRNVLRHQQDAEDAFQATFLVLARRAGSIRKRDALASGRCADSRPALTAGQVTLWGLVGCGATQRPSRISFASSG